MTDPEVYFEDLPAGRRIALGSVVVDRDEMLAFNRRFDPQPFHVDEDAAKASLFGGLCASGWFTASLWMRCYVDALLSPVGVAGLARAATRSRGRRRCSRATGWTPRWRSSPPARRRAARSSGSSPSRAR